VGAFRGTVQVNGYSLVLSAANDTDGNFCWKALVPPASYMSATTAAGTADWLVTKIEPLYVAPA
jgi:hypothetical protein